MNHNPLDRASRIAATPEATRQVGRVLGEHAAAGDVICLIGDLGSGKTTLTQGIGDGLGLPQNAVSSPTYSLIAEHLGGRLPLYHCDVYRLPDAESLHHLGLDDYLRGSNGLLVIEWADRILSLLPKDRLELRLEHSGADASEREIDGAAYGPRSARLITLL